MRTTSLSIFLLSGGLAIAAPLEAVAATTPLVASLGSSYSAGYGLAQSYGEILADLLAKQAGLSAPYHNYFNYAVSGSNVTAVPKAALKLAKKKYAAVVITAGGNDLNYVACLDKAHSYCGKTISKDIFVERYTKALDAIRDNVDDTTPIYLVDYTEALGSHTTCPDSLCNIAPPERESVAKGIYTNLIDWTVDAYDQWRSEHPSSKLKVIPMRSYSADKHDVGSSSPWINGSKQPKQNDGGEWHPNKAGVEFIAQAIYNDLNGLGVPPH